MGIKQLVPTIIGAESHFIRMVIKHLVALSLLHHTKTSLIVGYRYIVVRKQLPYIVALVSQSNNCPINQSKGEKKLF